MGDQETEVKKLLSIYLLICVASANSQELLSAEKEILSSVALGDKRTGVSYASDEEGFYSPGSPYVDPFGRIVFIPSMQSTDYIEFSRGGGALKHAANSLTDVWVGNTPLVSQQGISIASSNQYFFNESSITLIDYHEKSGYFDWDMNYVTPFGAILYSEKNKNGIAIVFDRNKPREGFALIDSSKLKSWLPSQPGGFTIGDDGLLYRNGTLWSAVLPSEYNPYAVKYVGRLMSGHTIWAGGGISNMERFFSIANAAGQWELILELPWAMKTSPRTYGYYPFNYGIGPWGELYALIAPYSDEISPWPPKDSGPAELVVVRNHLKYFGRLNTDRVRLRKEPNTTSDVIGTYPVKTGFRIVETGTKKETIGDKTDVWYKVRLLDGTEGWFFGAFVANLYDGPGTPPPWPNVADW